MIVNILHSIYCFITTVLVIGDFKQNKLLILLQKIKNCNRLSENMKTNKNKLCHMNLEIKRRTDDASRRENELKLYHRYNLIRPDVRFNIFLYILMLGFLLVALPGEAISQKKTENRIQKTKIV